MASMAQRIADTCVYKHVMTVDGGGYGQNIGAGALPENVPALITNLMYNGEIELYPSYGNEPDTSNFEEWGHYSQIVWKETKEVGCATKKCDHVENTGRGVKPYYTVCNYYPQGESAGSSRSQNTNFVQVTSHLYTQRTYRSQATWQLSG